MVKGKCIVNKQEHYKHTWPNIFVEVPRINDYIRGSGGLELKVIKVVHSTEISLKRNLLSQKLVTDPFIIIYLND